MKTRIIALLVVVVLAVSALAGCSYRYDNKDFTKNATVDVDKIMAGLQTLQVEDSTFTQDEETRTRLTREALAKTLSDAVVKDDDRKLLDGIVTENDVVSYCYYTTTVIGETTYISSTSNMEIGKASNLLLNGTDNTVLGAALYLSLTATEPYDLTDKAFNPQTTGTVPMTGKILVSYTVETTGDTGASTNSVTDAIVDLEDDALGRFLTGKALNTKVATGNGEDSKFVEGNSTYSNVTVLEVMNLSNGITLDLKPYTAAKNDEKDMFNKSYSVTTDTTVTYHVFLTARYDVADPAVAAEVVSDEMSAVLADEITASSLTIFSSEEYAYTEGETTVTLKSYIESLVTAYADKATADTAKSAAETAYTSAIGTEEEAAKYEALNAAVATLANATAKVSAETVMGELTKLVKGEETAVTAIYNELYNTQYDSLKSTYVSEMQTKIKKAAGEVLKANITINDVPKAAWKEAYDQNYENYKYTYYSSDDNQSTYKTLDDFLMATMSESTGKTITTKDDMKAALEAEAQDQVKDVMFVYLATDILQKNTAGLAEDYFKVTKDEINDYADNIAQYSYLYYLYGISSSYYTADQVIEKYGETNLRTEILASKLSSYFIETKLASDDENYNAVDFKYVSYATASN